MTCCPRDDRLRYAHFLHLKPQKGVISRFFKPVGLLNFEKENEKSMKINLLILVLLALWIPVSIDKIINFEVFKSGILRQPFSDDLGRALVYVLPVLEFVTVALLLRPAWQKRGFALSALLMLAFTAYIGIALAGAWEHLPCGCGSVIGQLTWKQHFFFNLFFLLVSGYGFYLMNLKRGGAAGGETAEGGPA